MSIPKGRSQETADQRRHRMLRGDWRGVYEPPDLSRFERTVGDVVEKVLKRAGLGERLAQDSMIREWSAVVGDFLASQSKPTGLRNGVLQVSVLQAAVRYDLERNLKRDILKRLQERFGSGVVRDLRFTMG